MLNPKAVQGIHLQVAGLIILVGSLIGLATPALAQQPKAPQAVKVLAQTPQMMSDGQNFEAIGTAWADKSVNLFPVVEEHVKQVYFKAQQKVKKNTLLVQLEDKEEQLALRLAQSNLKNAQLLLTRYLKAVEQGAVPQTQVDQAQVDLETAQVAVERARLALEDRQVRAPFTGYVGIPGVEAGQRVGPEDRITGIDSRESVYIDIEIPEALIPFLSNNEANPVKLKARTPALANQEFVAEIGPIENRVNSASRTLRARAYIDNKDDLIRPGMSFTLVWAIAGTQRPAIDEIALQWSRDGAYVWVVDDMKARKVPVKVISRQRGLVLLEGDLTEKDQIIVEGVQRVREGAPVDLLVRNAS